MASLLGIPGLREGIEDTAESYNVHKNYGLEGLLGQYLLNRHINTDKFNVDLSKKRFDYRPNEDWEFYARDDSPRYGGVEIGGKYHF